MQKTVLITVKGNVQGVFFRQRTKEKAESLGIKGQVENLENGDVQIIATGQSPAIDELVNWCQTGPPRARVEKVIVMDVAEREFGGFSIVRG